VLVIDILPMFAAYIEAPSNFEQWSVGMLRSTSRHRDLLKAIPLITADVPPGDVFYRVNVRGETVLPDVCWTG
jgi:hypothetical protein